MNDAEDRLVFVDLTFVPLLEAIADRLPTIERYVVLTDGAHMPATKLKNAVAYEDWIGEVDGDFRLGGVRRAHRGRPLLHLRHDRQPQGRALFPSLEPAAFDDVEHVDMPACSTADDSVLPVVPMFHANSWGLALLCPMRGAQNGDAGRRGSTAPRSTSCWRPRK